MSDSQVAVKGPLGFLEWHVVEGISVAVEDGAVKVSRAKNEPKYRALHGMVRAELHNLIRGVTNGFERSLEIQGVGYKGQVQGKTLNLSLGFTHPVEYVLPDGVEAKVDKQTLITIRGIDKRKVGQVAADIRGLRPPDVYKQKGIRYAGEQLRKKEGKTGK